MSQIAIIGAGAWGTGLSIVLGRKGTHRLRLWAFEKEVRDSISSRRVNELFLPGHSIPDCVLVTGSLDEALHGAEIVVSVMPSQHCRRLFEQMRTHLQPKIMFVSATKGLEEKTLLRMTEVISQVIASGGEFQPRIGALKNIIAIAAGVCDGLGLGHNSIAALITRGLAEITRLAMACGGRRETMAGLAGVGDLVLTCTGGLSRNRSVGVELGRGRKLSDIIAGMHGMVAEGVFTTHAALGLARARGVEMPITQQMNAILHEGKSPSDAIQDLMTRSAKSEVALSG